MKEERIDFKNSEDLNLVGILHTPDCDTEKVIIMSHPFTSNKDRFYLVNAAKKLCKEGYAVFRFDFRGSGESESAPITVSGLVDDLKSAIKLIRGRGYEEVGLLGASLGALCSILAYNEEIKTMVFWAPVTKAKKPSVLKSQELQTELEEKGYIIMERDGKKFRIEKQYLTERENVNQGEILSRIKCPVLIIHGDNDEFVPIQHSKMAMQYLSKESKLEVFEGSGHKLNGYEEQLAIISSRWFKKWLI